MCGEFIAYIVILLINFQKKVQEDGRLLPEFADAEEGKWLLFVLFIMLIFYSYLSFIWSNGGQVALMVNHCFAEELYEALNLLLESDLDEDRG